MTITQLALPILLLALNLMANDYKNSMPNIKVSKSNESTLSIQNLSNENLEIDILGNILNLKPTSGLIFACSNNETFLIGFKTKSYNFIEVQCKSNILINESHVNSEKGA